MNHTAKKRQVRKTIAIDAHYCWLYAQSEYSTAHRQQRRTENIQRINFCPVGPGDGPAQSSLADQTGEKFSSVRRQFF
jgi:hypothetical protein